MDSVYTAELMRLGGALTELAVKGTATSISNKIKTVKDEKNAERLRATYDEVVNELLNEREEAVRIAQAYKSELEKVIISDEDIKHLHNTVTKILEEAEKLMLGAELEKLNQKDFALSRMKG